MEIGTGYKARWFGVLARLHEGDTLCITQERVWFCDTLHKYHENIHILLMSAYVRTCNRQHTHMHTHMHTHARTHMHMHMHTHTHVQDLHESLCQCHLLSVWTLRHLLSMCTEVDIMSTLQVHNYSRHAGLTGASAFMYSRVILQLRGTKTACTLTMNALCILL